MKLKKGDTVLVISGKDKNKVGVIQKVFPKENKVIVDGVNVQKKHVKPTQNNAEGSIVEVFGKIDASNVMYYDEKSKVASRLGYQGEKKDKVRFMKATGKVIE